MNRALPAITALVIFSPLPAGWADDAKPQKAVKPVEVKDVLQVQSLAPGTTSVSVNYRRTDQFTAIMKTLARNPHIRHLALRLPNSRHVKEQTLDVLRDFQLLESLELRDARDWQAPLIFEHVATMKNLKRVRFEFFCRSPSESACKAALRRMKELESATFSDGRTHRQEEWEQALTRFASDLIAKRKAESDKGQESIRTEPFVIGNREEPTETQLLIISKVFCVALRKLNNDESKRAALRVFFDPRYLEKHDLKEGAFPVKTVAVGAVFNIQIANDRRTAICEVQTEQNPKELLLLRLTVHDGKLYLTPVAPPDPKTRSFTPWIFRMKI